MPFHIRLGSIKKLTLFKREFFYRVPEIGIRNQTTELRREGVRKQVKNGSKGNRRNDKPKLLRFTDQPLDPVEDHLRFYAPDTAVIAIFTGFLSIYGARSASEIGLQDTFLSEPVTQKAEPGMGRSPHRHGGRSHERSQMHHQRIHRHHAIQVGNEVHLIPQLYLAIQCRDVRIERLHAAGEFGFLSAAAVDENPVETPAQQTDGFGAQLFGISLARLGGERRETDPYTLFFSHGIGSGAFLAGRGSGKSNPKRRKTSQ